ncbi:MAG TPA: uracil-DNA glycosylase [Stellaceae bacterium]|nr:uracil-DNA glycosylase [Stellaceae bacterium]
MATSETAPGRDCPLCPRLVDFRLKQRAAFPDWHNAPVPSFGDASGRLLIVGLAPGLRGANRTGRPFTGDYAGNLLYQTLLKFGFASGVYRERPDDGLTLVDCRIANAVRCVPPENKPEPSEIRTCHHFLLGEIAAMTNLRAVLALGKIAHDAAVRALGGRIAGNVFAHGAVHDFGAVALADSYHCSRYNTNTGRLTTDMFESVVGGIRTRLG